MDCSNHQKRVGKTADEFDAYSKWRHIIGGLQKAGAVKWIKTQTHRRERREARAEIQKELNE